MAANYMKRCNLLYLRKFAGRGNRSATRFHERMGPPMLHAGHTTTLTVRIAAFRMLLPVHLAAFVFVPLLVQLLRREHNADIMLLASRAMCHMMDVLPSSPAALVHYDAVPLFCERLLSIEYIDLAEQSLSALEKLSHEHPLAILRAGGMLAVLQYVDFFATGVQRVAVSTAANLCRGLPVECAHLVADAVPQLTGLLNHHDQKVLEHVCLGWR